MKRVPTELLKNRSHPHHRAVLEDWLRENDGGQICHYFPWWIWPAAAAAAADAADADAAAAAAAAAADAAAADDAAADAAADADAYKTKEPEMREGLAVIVVPGSRYGYSLTRIGWLRQVTGDEWEIEQSRVLLRESWSDARQPFREVAESEGKLKKGHFLDAPSKVPESVHRLQVTRVCCVPLEDYPEWVEVFPGLADRLAAK